MPPLSIQYEIREIGFDQFGDDQVAVAVARGIAAVLNHHYEFEMVVSPIEDGQWRLVHMGWRGIPPTVLGNEEFLRSLVNRLARCLDTINMWPTEQGDGAAQLVLNEMVIPPEVDDRVIVSFRSSILNIPTPPWVRMWEFIERRVKYDHQFKILGFDDEVVLRVVPVLRRIFSNEWVEARYRAAGFQGMGDPLEQYHNGWFPAYHLARAAIGAICRDPGWNYLIEIGLALEELRDFDGITRLERQLARSPGTQHHVCLAAELHSRGRLQGLEQPTGRGSATNDLLVADCCGNAIQVEVKEFSSRNPADRLRREIQDKRAKLPDHPNSPVVFHAVLIEDGIYNRQRESTFIEAVNDMKLPAQISAVVVGRRFVASNGGRVRRDIANININEAALRAINEDVLRSVFESNDEQADFPHYGIGTFFVFGNAPPQPS